MEKKFTFTFDPKKSVEENAADISTAFTSFSNFKKDQVVEEDKSKKETDKSEVPAAPKEQPVVEDKPETKVEDLNDKAQSIFGKDLTEIQDILDTSKLNDESYVNNLKAVASKLAKAKEPNPVQDTPVQTEVREEVKPEVKSISKQYKFSRFIK